MAFRAHQNTAERHAQHRAAVAAARAALTLRRRPVRKTARTALPIAIVLALATAAVTSSAALAQFSQRGDAPTRTAERPSQLPPVSVDVSEPKSKSGRSDRRAKRSGNGNSSFAIVALVNDEPVTGYEIEQRAAMLSGGGLQEKAKANFKAIIKSPRTNARLKKILDDTIKSNEGKSREQIIAIFERRKKQFSMQLQKEAIASAKKSALPGMRKQALDELIDEKLKLQEAKRLNVSVSDEDVDRVIKGIADRNKMTTKQLAKQLGGSLDPMKRRIRSTLSWNDVVRRQYGATIAISNSDVDRYVASNGETAEEQVMLQLQRVQLIIPAKLNEGAMAKRVLDADRIRAKFTGCASSRAIVQGEAGVTFTDLGKVDPKSIPEPNRTMILNARDGEILPPSVGKGGVELWIVCGREQVKTTTQQRTAATNELKQKEFELLGKRHLKDLRQDALIEYR